MMTRGLGWGQAGTKRMSGSSDPSRARAHVCLIGSNVSGHNATQGASHGR